MQNNHGLHLGFANVINSEKIKFKLSTGRESWSTYKPVRTKNHWQRKLPPQGGTLPYSVRALHRRASSFESQTTENDKSFSQGSYMTDTIYWFKGLVARVRHFHTHPQLGKWWLSQILKKKLARGPGACVNWVQLSGQSPVDLLLLTSNKALRLAWRWGQFFS